MKNKINFFITIFGFLFFLSNSVFGENIMLDQIIALKNTTTGRYLGIHFTRGYEFEPTAYEEFQQSYCSWLLEKIDPDQNLYVTYNNQNLKIRIFSPRLSCGDDSLYLGASLNPENEFYHLTWERVLGYRENNQWRLVQNRRLTGSSDTDFLSDNDTFLIIHTISGFYLTLNKETNAIQLTNKLGSNCVWSVESI